MNRKSNQETTKARLKVISDVPFFMVGLGIFCEASFPGLEQVDRHGSRKELVPFANYGCAWHGSLRLV